MTEHIAVLVSELFIGLPETPVKAQLALGGSQLGVMFLCVCFLFSLPLMFRATSDARQHRTGSLGRLGEFLSRGTTGSDIRKIFRLCFTNKEATKKRQIKPTLIIVSVSETPSSAIVLKVKIKPKAMNGFNHPWWRNYN